MPLPSNARLTPHFTAGELRADSPLATAGVVANLSRVALFLEVVRETLGVPIQVTSGFRPPAYNASVGGSSSSSHVDGLAADFVPIGGPSMYDTYRRLSSVGLPAFDQLIYYPSQGHIHVGLGSQMRREVRVSLSSEPGGTPILTSGLLAALPGYVADVLAPAPVASSPAPSTSGLPIVSPSYTGPVILAGVGIALALIFA